MLSQTLRLSALPLLVSASFAQVYVGDVVMSDGFGDYDVIIGLSSSIPIGEGACGFFLESIGMEIGEPATRISPAMIAETYALYSVADGVVFDAAYASAHTAIVNNSGTLPSYTVPYTTDEEMLFAYWDDRASFGGAGELNEIDATDLYGWMRVGFTLEIDPDTFEPFLTWTILDSATTRGGIIVGTYTAVPEPATVTLMAGLAALALPVTRRRRR